MPNPLLGPLLRWFGKLSYPRLFAIAAFLFVADTLVPDMIPFADELLLGLGTLLLANWKKKEPTEASDPHKPPIEGDAERR
jgi:hypothetical protein